MSVGIRHDDLRRRNRAMVIAAVRRAGQPSRTEIAGTTGLSHSTISAISSDLIDEGILLETKGNRGPTLKRGRPQVALAPQSGSGDGRDRRPVVELPVRRRSSTMPARRDRRRTPGSCRPSTISKDELVGEMLAMVRRLVGDRQAQSPRPILRIVVGYPGHHRRRRPRPCCGRRSRRMTDIRLRRLCWKRRSAFRPPVENDCNMIAVALRWRNPERYRDDFIAILLSHGIGMGLVLKGELFTGTQSSGRRVRPHDPHRPDGALCRCGRRGCVEAYAGNYAIWRNATRHERRRGAGRRYQRRRHA